MAGEPSRPPPAPSLRLLIPLLVILLSPSASTSSSSDASGMKVGGEGVGGVGGGGKGRRNMFLEGESRRRPPWQMGPRCERLVGLNFHDCRGFGEDGMGQLPPILEEAKANPEKLIETVREMRQEARRDAQPPRAMADHGNVSHIDGEVGGFTHEELLRFRPPGGGPIDRIPPEDFEAFRKEQERRVLEACPFGPDDAEEMYGLPPTWRLRSDEMPCDPLLRTRYTAPPDPHRSARLAFIRAMHYNIHYDRIFRQVFETGSFSGHDRTNEDGEFDQDVDLLHGQNPHHDLKADMDERLRVLDWRLSKVHGDVSGVGVMDRDAVAMEVYKQVDKSAAGGDGAGNDSSWDEFTQNMLDLKGEKRAEWAMEEGGLCYGSIQLPEGKVWAYNRWGHPLRPPHGGDGDVPESALSSEDVGEDEAGMWTAAERRARKDSKKRHVRIQDLRATVMRRVQDEWGRRELRKLMRLARRKGAQQGSQGPREGARAPLPPLDLGEGEAERGGGKVLWGDEGLMGEEEEEEEGDERDEGGGAGAESEGDAFGVDYDEGGGEGEGLYPDGFFADGANSAHR